MTRDRAKELLPVIQAYAEGKEIQYRKDDSDSWRDVGVGKLGGLMDINVEFECQWRVKPEPRVWWCVTYDDGRYSPSMFTTYNAAITHQNQSGAKTTLVKVQEVL